MKTNKGFKVTNANMQCRDFQFELGEVFKHDGEIELCSSGFHFCKKLARCFDYYSFNPNNRVFEIEHGEAIGNEDDKMVTDVIVFVRELTWSEVLDKVNTGIGNSGIGNSGKKNSGYWNSGNRNSGYGNSGEGNSGNCNTGDWNSGDRNSGYGNSGYWNSGYWSYGCFNTHKPKQKFFNKEVDVPLVEVDYPGWLFFEVTEWCDYDHMTDEEKGLNPNAETAGGYLKVLDYKEAAQLSYNNASKKDQDLIELLPNYDADILFEIFGIDRRK